MAIAEFNDYALATLEQYHDDFADTIHNGSPTYMFLRSAGVTEVAPCQGKALVRPLLARDATEPTFFRYADDVTFAATDVSEAARFRYYNLRVPLVITEEDYIEFLTVVGRANIGVPELIKGKFVRNTLLFLGYSLEDWDFRALFKVLTEPLPTWDKPVSFAIQRDPSDFWVRYWDRKGVRILKVDLYEFAEELERRFQQAPGRGRR